MMPFSIVGSEEVIEVNGEPVRARSYPWGVVEVDNPQHSDVQRLRGALLSTHLSDLKELTVRQEGSALRGIYLASLADAVLVLRIGSSSFAILGTARYVLLAHLSDRVLEHEVLTLRFNALFHGTVPTPTDYLYEQVCLLCTLLIFDTRADRSSRSYSTEARRCPAACSATGAATTSPSLRPTVSTRKSSRLRASASRRSSSGAKVRGCPDREPRRRAVLTRGTSLARRGEAARDRVALAARAVREASRALGQGGAVTQPGGAVVGRPKPGQLGDAAAALPRWIDPNSVRRGASERRPRWHRREQRSALAQTMRCRLLTHTRVNVPFSPPRGYPFLILDDPS